MKSSEPSLTLRSPGTSLFPCALVAAVGDGIEWSPAARALGLGLMGGLDELEALVRSLVPLALEPEEPVSCVSSHVTQCLSTAGGEEIFLRAEVASGAQGEHHVRFIDDTAHAQTARQARRDGALLERLIEALPVAIFTKDPKDNFRLKRVNRCFEETFGVARRDFVGRFDEDLFAPELIEGYRRADEAVFLNQQGVEVDEFIETKRGLRAAKTIKVPLFDEDGNPELLLGILQDVEDLHALVRGAEQASALKSRFLANMSHEIRTPIYGILGMLEASKADATQEDRDSALTTAETCARTLLAVINDILDLSKVEEGELSIAAEPFDLCSMLHGVVASLCGYGLERRVDVKMTGDLAVTCSAGITDPSSVQVPLIGDEGRMGQVLVNLLSNAMKFSPEGGTVSLDVQRSTLGGSNGTREFVRIEVVDRGAGIPKEDQETIFAPFGQSTLAGGGHYQSTGLGLAIVRQIVELLGGRVGVISEVGEGSTFWVELTLDHGPMHDTGGSSQRDPEEGTSDPATPLRPAVILVAEDNPVNQRIIRRTLEKAGHDVTIVGDGEAAVEAALAGAARFDFVLMDIQMPKLDGFGATRVIREAEQQLSASASRLPIIALTANAMKGDDDLCMEAGFDGYLTKPLDKEDLFKTMAELDVRPPPPANEAA